MAGISLEEYAVCLGAQLAADASRVLSVQTIHHSNVDRLLQDMADASQPRFGDLVCQTAQAYMTVGPTTLTTRGSVQAKSLALLAPSQQRTHVEDSVLRIVRDLTGARTATLTHVQHSAIHQRHNTSTAPARPHPSELPSHFRSCIPLSCLRQHSRCCHAYIRLRTRGGSLCRSWLTPGHGAVPPPRR